MKKRGISGVIVTVLMILISIIAITIVWLAVRNLVKSGTEQVDIGTFSLDLEVTKAEYVPATPVGILTIEIKRNPGEGSFDYIKVVLNNATNSYPNQTTAPLNVLELDTYDLSFDISSPTTVEIYPVTLKSGKEIIGNKLDTETVQIV